MNRRVAALLAAVAFAVAAVAPASATAIDALAANEIERPPFAQMSRAEARERALAEPELARARALRPGSVVRVRWLPSELRWRVSVRAGTEPTTLALVEIDDATGRVVRREALELGAYPPRHTEREVIDAAVADRAVRRLAREWGGVQALRADVERDGCCWEVDFFAPRRGDGGDPARAVVRAEVVDTNLEVTGAWTGLRIPWKMARGDRDAFGGELNEPFTWYALCILFALVVVDWARLRSLANLDAVVLLAFAASYEAFVQGAIEWSVPLAVPPLAWLIGRMGWTFLRGVPHPTLVAEPRSRFARLALRPVPTVALVLCCVVIAGIRIGLTVEGGNVIDVGHAGVSGARLELAGQAPWGNMPDDITRGDTYGPANYLAYVPATALLDERDEDAFGTQMPAAQATAIAADLGCALLLALVGARWISRRAGALLALGWLTCPWTTLALASGANDSLVALALLAAFAALPHAWLRGAFVAVAAMVKFVPVVALAPLLHVGSRARLRQSLHASLGFAAVALAGLAWVVVRMDGSAPADLATFFGRTLGFQATRDSPFSPWGLYGWDLAQLLLRVAVALLVLLACACPRARDAWQVAAGIAALLAAVQLTADHWFYLYLPWIVPFVLLVLVAQRERPAAPPPADAAPGADMLPA